MWNKEAMTFLGTRSAFSLNKSQKNNSEMFFFHPFLPQNLSSFCCTFLCFCLSICVTKTGICGSYHAGVKWCWLSWLIRGVDNCFICYNVITSSARIKFILALHVPENEHNTISRKVGKYNPQRHSVTFQKFRIFSNTAVRTSNLSTHTYKTVK